MKKLLIFAMMIFVASLQSFSQDFHYGIVAGANLNKMSLDTRYHLNEDTENYGIALGFRAGGFAEYLFNEHIGVQAELYYAQYGYRITNEYKETEYTLDQKYETTTNDVSLSLYFKYYILNQRLAFDLGVQPSFCAGVKRHEETNLKSDNEEISIDTTYRLNMGDDFVPFTFAAVGGMTFYLRDNLYLSARYIFGLTDLFKEEVGYIDAENGYYTERLRFLSKNRVIQLSLGWRF